METSALLPLCSPNGEERAARTGGAILAAVDVGNNDEDHRRLHASIIDHGYAIAGLAKGDLHVIAAHPSPMLSASDPTYQLSETIEQRYREACTAFQAEFGISDDHLHIAEGRQTFLFLTPKNSSMRW